MTHRIVVLGAGYAGLSAANRAARQLRSGRVTLVNASDGFVHRVRLHEVGAGRDLPDLPLADLTRGTGVELVVGRVGAIDPAAREVRVDTADGSLALGYDALVYALGSAADTDAVPGVAEHADTVAGVADATAFRARVAAIAGDGGAIAVVGAGSTGIEAATELAETHRGLLVRLVSAGEPGDWLSPRARAHLRRVFDRLGVEVVAGEKVVEVTGDAVVLADGRRVLADGTLWTTGFRVSPLAEVAGLAVDATGRVLVDGTLRSVSHPDVHVVGDAASVRGPGGRELRMACATALPMGRQAADAIVAGFAGREPRPLRFRYGAQSLSLGRLDGLVQFVRADDTPHGPILTGRAAALFKETVMRSTIQLVRHPALYPRIGSSAGQ
ncbi:oxidoreductase [Solihabitans fulvus]|uniref:Oxidoreductase n=1 Tax=Solihabitans fulvus TaxID=1892852 RepID=A0A5B2WUL7_9PSEU|nr:FAD-dependent oxidoreductase [Solihabitans fulvus]KAA2255225.1 oxidoreductase [Solihabitans fulvus]